MNDNNGGSAFPEIKTTSTYTTDINIHSVGGMTLRDYFAAKAPEAPQWYRTDKLQDGIKNKNRQLLCERLIEWRWYYAGLMLEARSVSNESR